MRVGVIGVGSMGQNHARVYAELGELVGVCDKDSVAGKVVAQRFGTSCFSSHDDLLSEGVEAVSIATPTDLHFDIAREAIDRGVHVLLEKPFCGDVRKAEKLTQLARDQGVVLAAGMIERHNPVVEFAQNAVRQGVYGDVITVSSRRVSSFPSRVRDVGVMMDLGIHDIDVMRHLVGSDVTSVYSVGGKERHEVFEDHATALLTFTSGVTGVVEVNWLTPMKVRKLALTCLKHFVELDYVNQTLEISSSTLMGYDPSDLYQAPFEHDVRRVALKKQEPLKREIGDFLRAIEEKREPLVDGGEAVKTLAVVAAIMESHAKGVPVKPS
ncbi:MAG: Gfo/Idh/MocA family oxidoreductase [Thermoplasmata archaeon]